MTITLPVTTRDNAISTEALRAAGQVPGVVYGPKQAPLQVAVEAVTFDKVLKAAGESTIVNLEGLDTPLEVLIKEVDFNPVKQGVVHVDFYAIERGKDMTVTVPLHFEGEAPAEHNRIGSVTKVLHEIEVTCRPSNLPAHITVDVSSLVDAESQIHVSDLPVLDGVTYEAESTEVVAVVSVAEESTDDEAADVDMSAIAVEPKGKTESVE